jgi:hypothetical protein
MAGLVPAIHVFCETVENTTWMPGTRPGMTKVFKKIPAASAAGISYRIASAMSYFTTIAVNG